MTVPLVVLESDRHPKEQHVYDFDLPYADADYDQWLGSDSGLSFKTWLSQQPAKPAEPRNDDGESLAIRSGSPQERARLRT